MNIYLLALLVANVFCLYLAKNKVYSLWMPNKIRYHRKWMKLEMLSPKIQYLNVLSLTVITMVYILLPAFTVAMLEQDAMDQVLAVYLSILSFVVCFICSDIIVNTLIKLWIKIERPAIEFDTLIRPVIKKMG